MRYLLAFALALASFVWHGLAHSQTLCGPPKALLDMPGSLKSPETLLAEGLMAQGLTFRLYLNPATGSFTVIIFNAARACIPALGTGMKLAPLAVQGDPS